MQDNDIGFTKSTLLRRLSLAFLSLLPTDKNSREIHTVNPWIITTTNFQEQFTSTVADAVTSSSPLVMSHEAGTKSQGRVSMRQGFLKVNPNSLRRKKSFKLRLVILVHCLIAWDRLTKRMRRRRGDGTLVTIQDQVLRDERRVDV